MRLECLRGVGSGSRKVQHKFVIVIVLLLIICRIISSSISTNTLGFYAHFVR